MTVPADVSVSGLRVSVVIPALNEARNLPYVLGRLPPDIHEVIVVDGHSVDDTIAVARQLRPDVRIVLQTRSGKGNALACGFAAATGDVIAMVDADGSADPGEILRFAQALIAGAEFAKGTRFAPGGGSDDITRVRALGNRALVAFVNLCHGSRYTDLCYGYNVFWRRLVHRLGMDADAPPPPNGRQLWGDGFEVETLIHLRVAAAGVAVTEGAQFRAGADPRREQSECGRRWPARTADDPGRVVPVPPCPAPGARCGRRLPTAGCLRETSGHHAPRWALAGPAGTGPTRETWLPGRLSEPNRWLGRSACRAFWRGGANMSFRREILAEIGGFAIELGRVDSNPFGCEETRLCLRVSQRYPDAILRYEPAAGTGRRDQPPGRHAACPPPGH